MKSIVSYPERGGYGNNRYRGNCSGRLIEDIISQYRLQDSGLSDFMVGGGTTEDVVRRLGLRGDFADLNRGYDMLSQDIPSRAENIFWHPPYHDMITYSGVQYDDKSIIEKYGFDPKINDLSRCTSWEDFVKAMNYCCLKQFAALEKGGRMFVLMGDMKRKGKLFSMLADICKPGLLEQIIIKAQHNCWSDGVTYSNNNFVPIVHEYLMVVKKEDSLYIPVSYSVRKTLDIRDSQTVSWRDVLYAVLEKSGCAMSLESLYQEMDGKKKTLSNPHWKEKIRQTMQNEKYFIRVSKGCYTLAK